MDGVATPEEYVNRAVELGMTAIAITDHGTLSGHRELHRIAKANGIKPILGIEGYLALDRHDKRDKSERVGPLDVNYFHIVLLAKNQQGLENLNKLNEISWTDGFYRKPRIDFEVLDKYGDGLIVLSACQGGLIAKAIENEEYAFAKEKVQWFKNRFKDDFYIELMPHNPKNINDELVALAKAFNVKVVVTPDCHHSDTSQKEIQEMMLLLNTHGKVLKDSTFEKSKKVDNMMERLDYLYGADRQMSFRTFDIHLLSYEEMKSAMAEQGHTDEEMFISSIEIADKVEDYDIKSGLDLLPVQYKKPMTDIDPIKHGLLFFRFINPERNDFPDIDSDIQDNRRDEVKDYLVRQYRHVASIATFMQFKDKNIVKDVSRVLNIPLADANKVNKQIDTWDEYCTSKSAQWFREKYPEVEIYGEQLRGRIKGTGIHAAGVVTSKDPIFRYAPMETRSVAGQDDRIPVVAVDMGEAENIGLIKIDALGLKTLTVLKDCIDIIKEREGTKIDLLKINMDDANVYNMLSDGYTKGVFQCEAAPYTNLLVKMRVKNLEELAASNALVRPGAMNTIGKDYIAIKHGRQNPDYKHQILKTFTEETYGCILYQEQVMQACVHLGGMSMSEADKVRKIIDSLLKNEKDKDARTEYLIEAKRMGISIKLPHINESDIDFKIEGKGIRFGLSSIKFISDKIAQRYIDARPFKSYAQLEEFTFTKGNGVNSRALQALRIIGAATFEDSPRNDQEIKENLYEYLNLPEFNMPVPQHYYAYIQEAEDYEETGSFVMLGMIKSIKRGKGWSRVEFLDKTGSVGIFDDENTTIETGKTYLILVSDNRIVNSVPADQIKESKDPLVKFLNYKQLPYKGEEQFVVSFKPRVTKAGKKMANLVVADAGRELHSVLVFPTAFSKAYMTIEEGNVYKVSLGKTKDGTVILEDVVNV